MSKLQTKPKLLTMFLAALVVFIMATGAFAGTADKSVKYFDNDKEEMAEVIGLQEVGKTLREALEMMAEQSELPEQKITELEEMTETDTDGVDIVIPINFEQDIEEGQTQYVDPNGDVVIFDGDNEEWDTNYLVPNGEIRPMQYELPEDTMLQPVTEINEFSSALAYITKRRDSATEDQENNPNSPIPAYIMPESPSGGSRKITMLLGADNPEYPGDAQGNTYKMPSVTTCSSHYNLNPQLITQGGTTIEQRGWTVFDLKDLMEWKGISVQEARLVIHNYDMIYIKQINFTLLSTTPSHNPSTTPVNIPQKVFTESGPTGTYIGNYSSTVFTDSVQRNLIVPLNTAAVNAINNKLSSIPAPTYYTYAIGMFIADEYTSNCQAHWRDIRLEVSFTSEGELEKGVAFGDDWSGYVKMFINPIDEAGGYLKTNTDSSGWKNGSYAMWDMENIIGVWSAENLTRRIKINKLSLRFNHYSGWAKDIEIRHIENPIEQLKSDPFGSLILWKDINDGDIYYTSAENKAETTVEYEWPLNQKAKDVFIENLTSGGKFFAVGWRATTTAGNSLSYSPKLVVDWEYYVTARLEDEPPEGFEATPLIFNATPSLNMSGGTGGLRYEWDWENDGKFDEIKTSPLANYTWPDDYKGKITLRVNDTTTNKNDSKTYILVIHNVDPIVNKTNGIITPQPTYEANTVTFSGFTIEDPGNDTWSYFYDFNGDLEYDVSGACVGKEGKDIPTEKWYFDDDFLGNVSLLVVDEDGGTTNLSIPETVKLKTYGGSTGFIQNSSGIYSRVLDANYIYMRWLTTSEFMRGWAEIDLKDIPDEAIITNIVFYALTADSTGTVFKIGVRLFETQPTFGDASQLWYEAGSGIPLFTFDWSIFTEVKQDLSAFLDTAEGKAFAKHILQVNWLGFGFRLEKPILASNTARLRGESYGYPAVNITYVMQKPGCLLPVIVKNVPPVINCANLTIEPKSLNETDTIHISNISFYDQGNDTYAYNISVDGFWTGWQLLGGTTGGTGTFTVDWSTNIALDALPHGSPNPRWIERWNDRILTGQNAYVGSNGLGNDGSWMEYTWENPVTIAAFGVHQFRPTGTRQLIGCNDMQYWDGSKYVSLGGYHALVDEIYNLGGPYYKELPKLVKTTAFRLYNLLGLGLPAGQVSYPSVSEWEVFSGTPVTGGGERWGIYGPGYHNLTTTINFTIPDNPGSQGTSWNDTNITVYIRDDDHHVLIPGTSPPEYTNGLDWCKKPIRVYNVAPELDWNKEYTPITAANEQEDFSLHMELTDPAAQSETETLQYNITWGNGDYTGWKKVTQFKKGYLEGLTEEKLQPGAQEGKDSYVWRRRANNNYGNNQYAYVGGYAQRNTVYRSLIEWDLSWIPPGFNITTATMKLYMWRDYTQAEKMHWYPITEPWVERGGQAGVRWNNQPGFDNSKSVASIDWTSGFGFQEFNLDTGIIQGWIDNSTTNNGMISIFDDEDNSDRNYGIFYTSDYSIATLRPQLILQFEKPFPRILPRGFFTESYMYPDDHPQTGTQWDVFNLTISVRDDDSGIDTMEFNFTVNNVEPEILKGATTPTKLAQEGIPEGTRVSLDSFRFDDVAFKEPTEFGFEYSIDWGDGTTPTPWADDFLHTSNAGEFFSIDTGVYQSTTYANTGRNLVKDSNNTFYAVYPKQMGGNQIFCGVSEDYGETWTSYHVSTEVPPGYTMTRWMPSIAIDNNGVLHVVWQRMQGIMMATFRYANSVDGGKTWGNFTSLPGSAMYIQAPSIAVDSKGTAHIVYAGYPGVPRIYNIYYNNRTANGTWNSFMVTSDTVQRNHWFPSIAVDSKDNVHVVWQGRTKWTGIRYNIQYRKLNSTTGTWDPIVLLTNTTSAHQQYTCIAADLDDNIHIVWSGPQIRYIKWDVKTGTWDSIEDVPGSNNQPSIGVDQRGYVYVVWGGGSPMMSVNDGTGWGEVMALTMPESLSGSTGPDIMFGNRDCLAERGICLVFQTTFSTGGTGPGSTRNDFYWTTSPDFYLGDFGPLRGIPSLTHFYPDDDPSGTDMDLYNLTLRVRDDDMGIGEFLIPLRVQNVWPVLDKTDLNLELIADENELSIPEANFMDPGTGPNETWTYWMDVDDSETLTPGDVTGSVTSTTVIENVTYGTIPPFKTTINDDYTGRIGIYVYDDDMPAEAKYVNYSFKGSNLVGYWKFDEGIATTAYDSSTYYNHGTINGATWAAGMYGNALSFDGVNDYVSMLHSASLDITDTITVSLWTKNTVNPSQWDAILMKTTSDWWDDGYGMFYNSRRQVQFYVSDYWANVASATISPRVWNHIVGTYDGSSVRIFVNSVLGTPDTYTGPISSTSAPLEIGRGADNLYNINGIVDEVAIFDRALNANEVQDIYNFGIEIENYTYMIEGPTFNKAKFDVTTENVAPQIIPPVKAIFVPGEEMKLPIQFSDQGSDDLYCKVDWGDGTTPDSAVFYNNGESPEPVCPPTHSAFNGTTPFTVVPELFHTYLATGNYMINVTLWDDDQWVHGLAGTYLTIPVKFAKAKEIKEAAIQMLEPLLPGHLDHLGYRNITLRYKGASDVTILVYNYIARPPYYWDEELFLSICNVQNGDVLEINASFLDEGMFGTSLILKVYDNSNQLINTTEIPTAPSCINSLAVGQTYGFYEVLGFGKVVGISYHHYSKFALKSEDAMDHILRSINRDPRRGYGWWHQIWVWWCGYTHFRGLWIDDERLDPQFGSVVFCEERWAVRRLMEVVLNCLNPEGVTEIEFEYIGSGTVDIEAYTTTNTWWNGTWKWIHREYDLKHGDSFKLNASMCNSTKLGNRIMFRVYDAKTGAQLDIIFVRTSGQWPLEVMPGNIYNEYWKITDSTLITTDNNTMWALWGEAGWWDLYFNFWSRAGDSRCGWDVDNCTDPVMANEEMKRVCSNLTVIWDVIRLLMIADKLLVQVAYSDAENSTIINGSYADENKYHLKMAKRYSYRATREARKGRPHHAITDYKNSWKHSILAMKYAFKSNEENRTEEPYDKCSDACPCMFEHPWWMEWYITWCNWEPQNYEENCGCN